MGILNKESFDNAFGKIKKATSDFISTVSENNSKTDKNYSCFCTNCGTGLATNEKFCHNCGTAVATNTKVETEQPPAIPKESEPETVTQNETEQKQEYVGNVFKCPNCGEILNSFSVNCPLCGYEIRNSNGNLSVQKFMKMLEQIETKEMIVDESKSTMKKIFGRDFENEDVLKQKRVNFEKQKEREKINLIANYPVPNNKEDIIEFMILASSNIDAKGAKKNDITKAWIAKSEQVYEKAKIMFEDTPDFMQIERIYTGKNNNIKKQKNHKFKWFAIISYIMGGCELYYGVEEYLMSGIFEIYLKEFVSVTLLGIGLLLLGVKFMSIYKKK